jgi:anaerobic dimethyl sulfoxide reductase subunit B (iron-sulfur subunit)
MIMSQYGFVFNADTCITCKSCAIACKDKHNHKPGRKFRKVHSIGVGNWSLNDGVHEPSNVYSYSVSIACNHCAKPACKDSCPYSAIGKREDGIVFIDRNLCNACNTCAQVCPYGEPSLDKEAMKMEKCDFCRELLEIGERPACVTACSIRALDYGTLDALMIKFPNAVQQVYPLASPVQTNPSLLIVPHCKSSGDDVEMYQFNMPEEIQAGEPDTFPSELEP